MKKLIYLFIAAVVLISSCGKEQITKVEKPDSGIFKDLVYATIVDDGQNSATAYLLRKQTKDINVYELEISYKQYDEGIIKEYKETAYKLEKYPAGIINDQRGITVKVMLPNEIFINVSSYPNYDNEFRKEELVKKMTLLFDLEGLEKLKGDSFSGKELVKYLPKFEKAL